MLEVSRKNRKNPLQCPKTSTSEKCLGQTNSWHWYQSILCPLSECSQRKWRGKIASFNACDNPPETSLEMHLLQVSACGTSSVTKFYCRQKWFVQTVCNFFITMHRICKPFIDEQCLAGLKVLCDRCIEKLCMHLSRGGLHLADLVITMIDHN